jgi:hypothetical protein
MKQMHIPTANISRQFSHLACVGYADRVHYNYDLPFIWTETGVHSWTKLLFWAPREQPEKQTARVHNTLCEGIILQKRFVKKSNWNFRNLEKKYNINFLSNIFQSGVINVTLCSLLIKTKQISLIYHKNCITVFLVIWYNF